MHMTIYTRKGDTGTSTVRGRTMAKNNAIFEAMGDIDELQAAIGLFVPTIDDTEDQAFLRDIQRNLYTVSALIAVPKCKMTLPSDCVQMLEFEIDQMTANLPQLKDFILPSGPIHVARTVCRRAERHTTLVVDVPECVFAYLNRLSDYLFTLARFMDHIGGNGGDILANDHQAAKSAPSPMTYKQATVAKEARDIETAETVDILLASPFSASTEDPFDHEDPGISSPIPACRTLVAETIHEDIAEHEQVVQAVENDNEKAGADLPA